jgi:DNA polymerase III gamma/tau subunit
LPLGGQLSAALFSRAKSMFEQIESLKREYTDKYVVVAGGIPELARFEGHVGQVKTVNMNGRALVEFDAWANIGWYDIELDCLKVVPKPEPKAEPDKHEKREAAAKPAAKAPPAAAGEKKLSPLEMARMQGAAKRDAAPSAAQPAPSAASAAPAPAAKGKMSTADILAAARAKKAAESSTEPAAPASAPAPPVAREPEQAQAAASAAPAAAATTPAAAKGAIAKGERPSVSEILAWCRAHDAK